MKLKRIIFILLVFAIILITKINSYNKVDSTVLTLVDNDEFIMLRLINEERSKTKIKPLYLNEKLCALAYLKAKDIASYHYPYHFSVKYGSIKDMLKNSSIYFMDAGENISCNVDIINSHTALMRSKSHRGNILNPEFDEIGIGIVTHEDYGNIYVQIYIDNIVH